MTSANPPPATNPDQARVTAAIAERLRALLDQETTLVRQGRYREALPVAAEKEALIGHYLVAIRQVQARAEALRLTHPESVTAVREAHARLADAVQNNLRVLATAKSISESLLQEVATAVTRQDVPLAYADRGTLVPVTRKTNRPIVVSLKT